MIQLNPFAISGLLIATSYLPLFLLILIKGRNIISRIFSLHLLCILIWGIGSFLIGIAPNKYTAELAFRVSYSAVIFIPIFYLHTVKILTKSKSKLIILLAYLQGIFFLILSITGKMFNTISLAFNSFYYHIDANLYFKSSFAFWIIVVTISQISLIRHLKKEKHHQKLHSFYLFLGLPFGFLGGISNFLPPLGINIYPFGNFLIPIFTIVATYAVLKHQLFNIELVIKKSLIYSILLSFVTFSYLLTVLMLEKFLQQATGYQSLTISFTVAILLGIAVIPFRDKLFQLSSRILRIKDSAQVIKENELLLQELSQSERIKTAGILASGIAHEIRNPLTAIKTFTEYLPNKINDQEFLLKFSRIVGQEVDRIGNLVQDLMDLAKPKPPQITDVNLNQTITDCQNFLSNDALKQNVNFESFLNSTQGLLLRADAIQLKQALLNIFLNALQAIVMPPVKQGIFKLERVLCLMIQNTALVSSC